MLDTAFPRIPGDAGNMDSYPFPARAEVIPGAGTPEVVRDGRPAPDLVRAFYGAAQRLEQQGAVALVSTCGFLISIQDEIARAVQIPVMVSALSLYPSLRQMVGHAPIGILTASDASLGTLAFDVAAIPRADVEVEGLEDCPAFANAILSRKDQQPDRLDRQAIEAAVVAKAAAILDRRPETRAFLLECGNLPPYAAAIRTATGRPVFSILDAAQIMWRGAQMGGLTR